MKTEFQGLLSMAALCPLLALVSSCSPPPSTRQTAPIPVTAAASPGRSVEPTRPSPFQQPANPTSPSPISEERINTALQQNKAAREGIHSYRLDMQWEFRRFEETPIDAPLPEGTIYSQGEGTWTRQGGKWRVDQRKRRETPPDLSTLIPNRKRFTFASDAVQEYALLAIYNGDDFAQWNTKSEHSLYYYPKESLDAGLIDYQSYLSPDPLRFGFGFGFAYLDEVYEQTQRPDFKAGTRWIVEEVNGEQGMLIRLTRSAAAKNTGHETRCAYWLDPNRDFLVVRVVAWNASGLESERIETDLQQLADGRWFPKEARWRKTTDFQRHQFNAVSVNGQYDAELFSFTSIPCDMAKTRMFRQGANGKYSAYLFREGQWIPEQYVPKALRPVESVRKLRSKDLRGE